MFLNEMTTGTMFSTRFFLLILETRLALAFEMAETSSSVSSLEAALSLSSCGAEDRRVCFRAGLPFGKENVG